MIECSCQRQGQHFSLDVSFHAGNGITALFGPSGAGKSTILNFIAGLERPSHGRIRIDGETVFDSKEKIDVPVHKRRVGYVFQDALLFPHLSVRQNLLYGFSGGAITRESVVGLLQIGQLLDSRPATLSGGERQRVAIGRALLSSPRLLLMDEPLAALDMARKREILPFIERLNAELKIPVVYVSHAVDEVARLASDVIVLQDGRITAQGAPQAVLPASESGGGRFARIAILAARIGAYDPHYRLTSFEHPAGTITLAGRFGEPGGEVRVVIRATDVTLALNQPYDISARTMLRGTIAGFESGDDAVAIATVALAGGSMLAAALTRKAADELGLKAGDKVWCLLKSVSIDERWIAAP